MARQHVFYINKKGFLPAFQDAFFNVFTLENYKKAFKASRLVPLNAVEVLERLKVRLRTPPEPPALETPWQSKTPSNTLEFTLQSKLVHASFSKSPTTTQSGFAQLIKGAELMLYREAL